MYLTLNSELHILRDLRDEKNERSLQTSACGPQRGYFVFGGKGHDVQ